MKKLLAIALVLGLAGIANAAVSLYPGGMVDVLPGDTITISVVSSDTNPYGAWLELTDNGVGSFGSLVKLPAAGADASTDDSWYPWLFFDAVTFNPEAPIIAGAHFTIDFTAGQVEGYATLGLFTVDETPIESLRINVVPEPMTLGLLGLGGLFLRRRK